MLKMVTNSTPTSPFKDHSNINNNQYKSYYNFVSKKLLPLAIYLLIPIALFRLCFYPLNFPSSSPSDQLPQQITILTSSSPIKEIKRPVTLSSSSPITQERNNKACDFGDGKWERDKLGGPMYNGTSCGTIKAGQNCLAHGRPDLGFLQWRWKPKSCHLPRFDPKTFLRLISNKHIAFVGDSMARNQAESLLCLLATSSPPNLVFRNGEDNKFRRWVFESHNATVSIYWSPFLVQGVEKSPSGPDHNELFLDLPDVKWVVDVANIDFLVLSIGHWFLHPAVYYESGSVIGCHYCSGHNHTEIGFYEPLRKAIRTAIHKVKNIMESKKLYNLGTVVTTFSPAHFEGEWDKAGACPRTSPYEEGEQKLEGMNDEIRRIEVEEVELAKKKSQSQRFDLEVLDVTRLGLMRPDGHPGPYMNPFPFGKNKKNNETRVQNDCVHWCLPGPIDTWNEILLQIFKRWELQQQ